MRLNRCVGVCLVVFAALLTIFVPAGFGQSATGTITGTVTDQKGLAMVGVSVQIHNVDTGADQPPVTTNDQGVYQAPLLPPGTYDVTVSQVGFSTVKRAAVPLQIGATARVDIEMPVSATQTLVTVTTEIPLLETEKTEQSQNVSENLVANLPVSSRRWEQFALLTPGVNPDGANGGMSFHGINNLYNNNAVDGANNNYNYDGGSRGGDADGYVYSGDSIREFQVSSTGFGAETGQSAGGSVNAVTKSGTNQLHGDLFYNGRAQNFNAIDPVAQLNADGRHEVATKNIHQQHQYGVSVGGPLLKDKLFFFTTLDAYRKVNPLSVTTNQLNPSIQQLTCPTVSTAATTPAGTTAPSAAECQTAKDYVYAHFIGQFPRSLRQDIELLKLDYQLNQANHLSGIVNVRDWHQPTPTAFLTQPSSSAGPYNQSRFVIANWTMVIGTNKVNEARFQWGKDNTFTGLNGGTGMPGVSLSNLFAYGGAFGGNSWANEHRKQISDSFSFTMGSHAFKTGFDMNFITDDIRSSSSSGGSYAYSTALSLGSNVRCVAPALPPGSDQSASSLSNANTLFCDWLMDLYGKDAKEDFTVNGSGVLTSTGAPNRKGQHWTTYNQFKDNIEPGPPETFRYIYPNDDYAVFFQDTWKMRPNMTVNWGLRYDLQVITDLPNSVAKVCAKVALLCVNPPGASSPNLEIYQKYTEKYPNEYTAIQPRLGVAWNIAKTTVLRFGGGMFFAKTEGHNIKNVLSGAGETTTNCTINTPSSCASSALTFPNVYFRQQDLPLWTPVLTGAVTPVVQTPANVTIPGTNFGIRSVDPALRRPRVYSANIAIEQTLPGRMNLSVSYIFTRGQGLPRGRDFNIGTNFDPSYCSTAAPVFPSTTPQVCDGRFVTKTYDVVNLNGVTQTSITLPFYTSRALIAGNGGTIQAAPAFSGRVDSRTGVMNGNTSDVYSRYNGLVVSVRKPMSHGVEMLANYTLSKSTDNGQQGGGNSGEGQVGITAIDPFNTRAEQGFSGTDTRNRFTASVIFAPSWGNNATGLKQHLLGGWSLASTVIAQNGSHYTASVQGNTAPSPLTYTGFTRGSTASTTFSYAPLDGSMGGAGVSSPGSNTAGRIAWVAPGSFILPNLYNMDMRLTKEFHFTERYSVEIRGEAFNVFNTTLIQGVSQTAYSYGTPSGSSLTCPSGSGAISPHAITTTCMVPISSFGQMATTSGNLLGARQMQAGIRFNF